MRTTGVEEAAVHPWLRRISLAYVPGPRSPLLEHVIGGLLERFADQGHAVQEAPDGSTDVIFTTAPFGEPISWRDSVLFTARRRFGLDHSPLVFTFVQAEPARFRETVDRLEGALERDPPDPEDYRFPGLAPEAWRVLREQGRRGGAILALERLVQAQTKSVRVVLVVGSDEPLFAYHFDLVGAHPRTDAQDREAFQADMLLRIVTAASTEEITEHEVVGEAVPKETWDRLGSPTAMRRASEELGRRGFFTEPVRIADLVKVPAVTGAVASQYSEGCFATWDPELEGLVATVTGSARPLDKGKVTEDDLAVIVGVRPDGRGALVRHVAGKRNSPPSSEAVEMMDMDYLLPRVRLPATRGSEAPVVRSKLHGHRGVAAFDPARVEHVALDAPYYHYLVSCASAAQAHGVKQAFGRSEALGNPEDPRPLAFTVLPGHGLIVAEKWIPGKEPFQAMWELMDDGGLEITSGVPQGPLRYLPASDGRMAIRS